MLSQNKIALDFLAKFKKTVDRTCVTKVLQKNDQLLAFSKADPELERSYHLDLYKIKSLFMFLNIVVNPETAHFEADLEAELQKTYRRLNITYEIVKMTGQALQKNAKYSQNSD